MEYRNPDALVSTAWLAENLDDPEVRVVDASFHLPTVARDARAEFERCHVPGAVFFDVDEICAPASDLPHMLPDPETFSRAVGGLGIGAGNRVVVYDVNGGCAAAARVWWTFRVFGHGNVAVLNGGLPKWLAEDHPTESGAAEPADAHLHPRFDPDMVQGAHDLLANLESKRAQVVDARNRARFAGAEPEPRPARKAGHIPGSLNLPFITLMNTDGVMRPADEIAAAFAHAGVDLDKPIVTTCGSGVTAAFLTFGLYLLGHENAAVYDGSWAEWGNRDDTPVER